MNAPRRVRFSLPPMTGEQAHAVAVALERALAAVWRVHRDALEEIQARPFCTLPPRIRSPGDPDYEEPF